jgi:hypothetical protein
VESLIPIFIAGIVQVFIIVYMLRLFGRMVDAQENIARQLSRLPAEIRNAGRKAGNKKSAGEEKEKPKRRLLTPSLDA